MKNNIYPIYTEVETDPLTICRELTEEVFTYPFFNEGVSRCLAGQPKNYDLDDISPTEEENDLVIKGIIFHTSNCGSTLLSNMLGKLSEVKVLSEPEAINGLLLSVTLYDMEEEKVMEKLKKIIRLYCKKNGSEKSLIIKLTSWNVFQIELIKKVLPETKWLFLDRETDDLVNSLEKTDGGFIDWWEHPVDAIRKRFLPASGEILDKQHYLQEMVSVHRKKANMAQNENSLFLKYPDCMEEFSTVLEHFQITATKDEIQKSMEMLAYDSKTLKRRPHH